MTANTSWEISEEEKTNLRSDDDEEEEGDQKLEKYKIKTKS